MQKVTLACHSVRGSIERVWTESISQWLTTRLQAVIAVNWTVLRESNTRDFLYFIKDPLAADSFSVASMPGTGPIDAECIVRSTWRVNLISPAH